MRGCHLRVPHEKCNAALRGYQLKKWPSQISFDQQRETRKINPIVKKKKFFLDTSKYFLRHSNNGWATLNDLVVTLQ